MKLLVENVDEVKYLTEESNTEGKEPEYFLEGVFLQANIENRNGRIYPLEVMQKAVKQYDEEFVQHHRAFGELDHPEDSPQINLKYASHIITKVWQEGNYFKARAKILDTPQGKIVKSMIKEGCQLGVSSRAMGSLTRKGDVDYVGDDFQIITAGDIVWNPSAQTAFPKGIMEDVEWDFNKETGEYIPHRSGSKNEKITQIQINQFKDLLESFK